MSTSSLRPQNFTRWQLYGLGVFSKPHSESLLEAQRSGIWKWSDLCLELNQWIHSSSFLSPVMLISAVAGPEEAKNLAGQKSSA